MEDNGRERLSCLGSCALASVYLVTDGMAGISVARQTEAAEADFSLQDAERPVT